MSDPTLPPGNPPDNSEPATGPLLTRPPGPEPALAPWGSPPAHVQQSSRLNKAAAWVGIAAGSLFIVVVIFGTGFFLGKEVGDDGDGPRGHHRASHEVLMRPGPAMPPMGPRGEFERRPGFPGPFGPDGPMIEIPQPPGGSGGPGATTVPSRP